MKQHLVGDGTNDDTLAIQALLDGGRSAVYLPPPPAHYLISRPLRIHSNQTLVLDRFTTIRLAPMSDCLMATNADHDKGNRNVSVVGGIWDMSNLDQSPNPIMSILGENPPRPYDPERYLGICMRFVNVEHFSMRSLTFRNPVTFCTQFAKMTHFTVDDIDFDYTTVNPIRANMDGIHLDGFCRFGRITNLRGATNDDLVAINGDDNDNESPFLGPIEDISIDGLYAEGCHSAVRILSSGSPMRRISISNVFGTYYKYVVGITQFFKRRGAVGIFDQITLRDCFCSKAPDPHDDPRGQKRILPLVWCEESTRTGTLTIEGMHRDERLLAEPCISIDRGASVDRLVINDLTCRNATGKRLSLICNNGHIGHLLARNLHGVAEDGAISLFDRSRGCGVIDRREIVSCDGMDATGADCARLPDSLSLRDGVSVWDFAVPHDAFSGEAVADAEADDGFAIFLALGEAAVLRVSEQGDQAGIREEIPLVEQGGYTWHACGERDLFYREDQVTFSFVTAAATDSGVDLRVPHGPSDRYRPWVRLKAGRSESGERGVFISRVVLEQMAPWREASLLQTLGEGWMFKTDPGKIGVTEQWFVSGSDARWQPISTDAPWTMQGHDYHGAAWYAKSFDLSKHPDGAPLWLVFHAVDGNARVWINGREAGVQECFLSMWCRPWALEVGHLLGAGGAFQIVMRVEKDRFDAGIFKPVEIRAGNK